MTPENGCLEYLLFPFGMAYFRCELIFSVKTDVPLSSDVIKHQMYKPMPMTDPWDWYIYLHENHKNQPFMEVNIPFPWLRHWDGTFWSRKSMPSFPNHQKKTGTPQNGPNIKNCDQPVYPKSHGNVHGRNHKKSGDHHLGWC